jgi:hypothetical protein
MLRVFGAAPEGGGEGPNCEADHRRRARRFHLRAGAGSRDRTAFRARWPSMCDILLEAFRNRFVAKQPPGDAGAPDAGEEQGERP